MYFTVTVKVLTDNGNGKVKKVSERYLVDAMSVTEAEARTTKHLTDQGASEFEVSSASVSRIIGVVEC